jgi:DNA-directed RNA polymerase specialized sigma24 family protein
MSGAGGGNARADALDLERSRADPVLEAAVYAADAALRRSAVAWARKRVDGDADAEDAVSNTWEKVLKSFDPNRGKLKPFFFAVLGNECANITRGRNADAWLSGDLAAGNEFSSEALSALDPESSNVEDELVEALIDAAIELLDLPAIYRTMLRHMSFIGQADLPADLTPAAARKQRQRTREEIIRLARLTPEELTAVKTVRAHRAADVALSGEVRSLAASAERKVLAFFGIEPGVI